ncbi:hypothetical protein GCM10011348_02110 [Marinobacterium nitratireducens]|uniref:Oxidoreductase probably involved in sulfite reduction n=1 Tax=Marinobacterium nitratireducens TaxID=518897 RepID=A0A917Z798_9GAMM|nr:DUF934 domain-containing protein [Marinobacterium nitratireducens]GGO75984.1 hypothetical protein GCM10011348_02110 [Marinobacterium nitratireducens]
MNNLIRIVDGEARVVERDPWQIRDDSDATVADYGILPLARWQALTDDAKTRAAVLLDPDDDPEVLVPWLDRIELIALAFPSFRDGRAYTQAVLLRSRLGFEGDLRAVGDVLRDQLAAMRHCGFSSFAVRDDRSAEDALKGLHNFDQIYARSVLSPEPLFRRRGAAGA